MLPPSLRPQWRDLYKFEGLYEITRNGQVRRKASQYPVRQNISDGGYVRVCLSYRGFKNIKSRWYPLHRLVLSTFVGPPKPGQEVNHINAVKTDNRVENLEWVTHAENMRHASNLGLMCRCGRKAVDHAKPTPAKPRRKGVRK
jgi:hypothetical protein